MPTGYALETPGSLMRAVSPFREMGDYKALWSQSKVDPIVKTIFGFQ